MEITQKETFIKKLRHALLATVGFFALVAFLVPSQAFAARLEIIPVVGTYEVGDTIQAVVFAESSDQAMNAASGVIKFPSDKLEIVSVSKDSSIFNFWVQEPVAQTGGSTVSFEGIVLNPGYTGPSGRIMTVTFRAKSVGTASLSFVSGSVLANDGLGTNILQSLGGATYLIKGTTPPPAPPATPAPIPVQDLPPAPTEPEIIPDGEDPIDPENPETTQSLVITDYKEVLQSDEFLIASGSGPVNTPITISVSSEYGSVITYAVRSNSVGDFTLNSEDVRPAGDYRMWARVAPENEGERGLISETVIFTVVSLGLLGSISLSGKLILLLLVLLVLLGVLLYLVLLCFWSKKKLRMELVQAQKALHTAFSILEDDTKKHISLLHTTKAHRKVTKGDQELIDQLDKNLKEAEGFIAKELLHMENLLYFNKKKKEKEKKVAKSTKKKSAQK